MDFTNKGYPCYVLEIRSRLTSLVLSVIISWAASESTLKNLANCSYLFLQEYPEQAGFLEYSSSLHGKPGLFNTLRSGRLKPGFPGYSEPGLPGKPWLTRLFAHMVSLVCLTRLVACG